MPTVTPNYIELTSADLDRTRQFYAAALGFVFTPYGPGYTAVEGGPAEVGFRRADAPAPPLPVFESDDVDTSLSRFIAAGGTVVLPITSYPGGRRFEGLDPDGHRIAVYQRA